MRAACMARGAAAGLLLLGCTEQIDRSDDDPVTFWEDVAPVVYRHCTGCHDASGIAPFELISYADVNKASALIKAVVESREMPPFLADASGSCQTFADAGWLSDEEIAVFGRWIDGGWQEGDPANAPPKPGPGGSLERVTHTLDIGADYTPDAGLGDDYRCFLVDPQISSDMFLVAHHTHPGDARVAHHMILYSLESDAAQQEAEALDAADPALGYTCFGGPGVPGANFMAGWVPGSYAVTYPQDTGVPWKAGRKAVMQMHYNTLSGSYPDRTVVDIELVADVTYPARVERIRSNDLVLPPGQNYVTAAGTLSNPANVPARLWGLVPHMHTLGVDVRVQALRGSESVCLVDIPRWDFDWQRFYFYDQPVALEPGDVFHIECGYSTLGQTQTVTWGEGTLDEMCIAFAYATL
jgi:hypothetical protein